MPAIVDRDAVRKKICGGLEQMLGDKPLQQISMRDIAAKIGMSHQKIYHYYETKEALLQDYISKVSAAYVIDTEEIIRMTDGMTVDQALETLIMNVFSIDQEERHTRIMVQIYGYAEYDASVKEMVRKMYRNWIASIQKFLYHVTGRTMEEEATALLVLLEGMVLYSLNTDYCRKTAKSLIKNIKAMQ